MHADKIVLQEWCQHQRLEIEFGQGLTAIMGPNGSGKSNVLAAMKFALTGTNINEGPQDRNVRQLSDPTATSHVEFTFTHAGRTSVVTRYLRPAARVSTMAVTGMTDPIRGDKKINEAICDMLNTDTHMLNDITIVDQADIFGFLDKTKSKRAEAFGKLFGTEDSEKVWAACRKHLTDLHQPAVVADVDATIAAKVLAEAEREELIKLINGRSVENAYARAEAAKTEIDNISVKLGLENRIGEVTTHIEGHQVSFERSSLAAQQAEADKAKISEAYDNIKEVAAKAHQALDDWDKIHRIADRKSKLEAQIICVKASIDRIHRPENDPNTCSMPALDKEEIAARIEELNLAISTKQKFVDSFKDGQAECYVCGTHTSLLETALDGAEMELPHLIQSRDRAVKELQECTQHLVRCTAWQREYDTLNSEFEATASHLESLEDAPSPPDGSKQDMLDLVADFNAYEAGLVDIDKQCTAHGNEAAEMKGRLKQMVADRDRIQAEFNANETDPALFTHYLELQTEAKAEMSEISNLERRLAGAEAEIHHKGNRIEEERAAAVAATDEHAWIDYVKEIRELTHRDAAPRFVFQRNLQRLQNGVNQYLSMFETDFRATATEGCSFEANFSNGVVQPAERLSGGQKVVLALAFRLAVHFMYADLGFLALDEPTAWLDEHHIEGFAPVLNRLREFTSSRGLQCIIVTHEQSLAPLFDQVIQL